MAGLNLARVRIPGRETIGEKAARVKGPEVQKPDARFCASAIESGYAPIPAVLTLPDGTKVDLELAPHAFSTGTLGWVARPNVVAKIRTTGGAERTLRVNGEFKLYLAGSKESVVALAAAQGQQGAADDGAAIDAIE